MQTRFICPHCAEEIFSWDSRSLNGLPIVCPHCGHGALTSPNEKEGEAFIVYSKPTTILWLAVRWVVIGGFCLTLLASALAILVIDTQHSLPVKVSISLLLLVACALFTHIAIYGRLHKHSQLKDDRKAHKTRVRSIR